MTAILPWAAAVVVAAAGCRLDPLVEDTPGASGHVLAAGTAVPSAADSPEIANQIRLNDGIDDKLLEDHGGVVPRGTGQSAGQPVRFWSFGPASRAPAPMFRFFRRTESGLEPIGHPAMVEALPGERTYSPLHTINEVVVTDRYRDELITSADALADAIDLGLVEAPRPTGEFITSPIVLPGTQLEVSSKAAVPHVTAALAYAHGYEVGMFEIGGAHRVMLGLLPISEVSFLRESNKPAYDANRPIFQTSVPRTPGMAPAGYTPLSLVIQVDLARGTDAAAITRDSDLYDRNSLGAIDSTTDQVQALHITTSLLVLPIQFEEDVP